MVHNMGKGVFMLDYLEKVADVTVTRFVIYFNHKDSPGTVKIIFFPTEGTETVFRESTVRKTKVMTGE